MRFTVSGSKELANCESSDMACVRCKDVVNDSAKVGQEPRSLQRS